MPRHIAIVMDGNGRWAQQRKRPRTWGHQAGIKAARRVARACAERGVGALTLFAFSSENWRRPASEVKRLMELFMMALHKEVDDLHKNNIRLMFIGDRSAFSDELQQTMAAVEARTEANSAMTLTIAMNYGGRWDIVNASRQLARKVEAGEISPEDIEADRFAQHLSLSSLPEPDLLIRTGGERRISNFLLWQLAYTEILFLPILWPDFDDAALESALADFASRERRFGQTTAQVRREHA